MTTFLSALRISIPTLIAAWFIAGMEAPGQDATAVAAKEARLKVLAYSNTAYYRHPDIPITNRWLVLLGHENGIDVD
ncbi:MAG: hypothetical protein ABI318_11050, partial [Chthoniobacteraceae bacterium]